ncbi:uncharacterized protein LOC134188261, partial [Corticium candelabrum]|uniref:uncharacterized protein LOC134188261 n=1 Tax=Corticium candelabrum TaxID=121492 RepID=UPI002E276294
HYYTGYTAYESVNYANHFLRHSYSRVRKSQASSPPSTLFKNDASFTVASTNPSSSIGPVSVRSKNYPAHGWYRTGTSIYIIRIYWRIVPGLDGQPGSVSFQSVTDSNRYIRHESFLLYERTNDGTSAFKKAATFYERKNHFYSGYDAYESVDYLNCFIRHAYSRFQIANNDGSTLFKNDASFKTAVGEK